MTLFNEKAAKAANRDLTVTKSNTMRSLFLCRIAALSLKDTKSLPLLNTNVKKEMEYTLSILNTLEEHTKPLALSPNCKWLEKTLAYDELADVGGIIETFSQITSEQDAKIYSAVAGLYSTLNSLRKRGKKIDSNKYLRFIELLTEELHAEASGGTTALDVVGDEVHFNLVKPKARVHD